MWSDRPDLTMLLDFFKPINEFVKQCKAGNASKYKNNGEHIEFVF